MIKSVLGLLTAAILWAVGVVAIGFVAKITWVVASFGWSLI
jgi:hypothetical protein